ncbi:hypothetical protein CRV24_003569 [Beauveria bassiana]|nr:hypothetical protein CRV24_003569 [Beauveria bassiana]
MSETMDAEGEAVVPRTEDVVLAEVEEPRQPSTFAQVPIADMMQITPDSEGNGSRPIGEASIQPSYENTPPTSSLNWSSGGLALPQGRVFYPPAVTTVPEEPLPNNASTVVGAPALKRSQRAPKPTAKAMGRVPTPARALIASPTRERHENTRPNHATSLPLTGLRLIHTVNRTRVMRIDKTPAMARAKQLILHC